jgi:hypothetical protein
LARSRSSITSMCGVSREGVTARPLEASDDPRTAPNCARKKRSAYRRAPPGRRQRVETAGTGCSTRRIWAVAEPLCDRA